MALREVISHQFSAICVIAAYDRQITDGWESWGYFGTETGRCQVTWRPRWA